jgi:hypothetical protein
VWSPILTRAGLLDFVPVVADSGATVWEMPGVPMTRAVPCYPINSLRHLAASLMIDDGLNAKKPSARMGHSSVIYDLYGHLFNEAEGDADSATRIEATFAGEQRSNGGGRAFNRHSSTHDSKGPKPAENRDKARKSARRDHDDP